MRPARGLQCRMRSSRKGQAIATGIGGNRRRLAPCPFGIERGRPKRAVAHGNTEKGHRHGKTTVIHEASETLRPFGERGFPPLGYRLPAGAGSLLPRPRITIDSTGKKHYGKRMPPG